VWPVPAPRHPGKPAPAGAGLASDRGGSPGGRERAGARRPPWPGRSKTRMTAAQASACWGSAP